MITFPNFTWSIVRDGEIGFVREYEDGRLVKTYGPMPAIALGPFVDECSECLREIRERLLGDLREPRPPTYESPR